MTWEVDQGGGGLSIQSKNHHGHYGQSSRNSFAYEKLITYPCCFLKPTTIFSCVAKLLKRRCKGIQRFAHSPGILRYKNEFVSFATPIPSEHQQWLLLWEAWSRAFVHSWLWRGQWFDISSNTTWVWFRLLKRGCYLGCRPPSNHQDYIFRWPGIPNKTGCNPPKSLGDFPSWRTVNLTSQNSWTNVPLMEEISASSGRYKKHSN